MLMKMASIALQKVSSALTRSVVKQNGCRLLSLSHCRSLKQNGCKLVASQFIRPLCTTGTEGCVVRIQGIPYTAKAEDVVNFFAGCRVLGGTSGVHFTYMKNGRFSGAAFVELESEEDVERAMGRDKDYIGKRYIEVFRSGREEMKWVTGGRGMEQGEGEGEGNDHVIRLEGLPWRASAEEVISFLEGCTVLGGTNGVHFTQENDGRRSGIAFVELKSEADVEIAFTRNKALMGKRYIDVHQSKRVEMEWMTKRVHDTTNIRFVRLRGVPWDCSEEDIANFFQGLEIAPNGITLMRKKTGRRTGVCFVEFASKEMVDAALDNNMKNIGDRHIEIFRSSIVEAKQEMIRNGMGTIHGFGPAADQMDGASQGTGIQ